MLRTEQKEETMPFKRLKWPFLTPAAVICLFLGITVCCLSCSKDETPADKAVVENTKVKKSGGKTREDREDTGRKKRTDTKAAGKVTTDNDGAPEKATSEKTTGDENPAVKKVAVEVNATEATGTGKPTDAGKQPETGKTHDTSAITNPASQKTSVATAPDPSRPVLPDPRLLLTLADIEKVAPARAKFRRSPLPGVPRTEDTDSIFFTPEKGNSFGFAVQLFRSRNAQDTKKRFETFQASYPSTQEIAPVSGKTFFSYWDEVLHIGFVHPSKNLVVIVSGGRSFCDGEKLMELAGRIAERLK